MRYLLPLVFLSLAACEDEEEIACDTSAAVSVTVSVVDDSGSPILDAEVTYSADGGDPVACDNLNSDGTYFCGYEVAGEIVIVADSDLALNPAQQTVTIEQGECHVVGQSVTLTLSQEDPCGPTAPGELPSSDCG